MGEESPFPPPPPPTPSSQHPNSQPTQEPAQRPRRLRCAVQNYDWGRVGATSTVARLSASNSGVIQVDDRRPYSEFWMGTHPSGPSYLEDDGIIEGGWRLWNAKPKTLRDWIKEHPKVLGDRVTQRWGCELPFLFKVLSVNKALSIQAHPDKALAEKLHYQYPAIYKDANHKPEMAVALTQFRALCGFVSIQELKSVFTTVPEIVEMVGEQDVNKVLSLSEHADEENQVKGVLRSIFTRFMAATQDVISNSVSKLTLRLMAEREIRLLTEKEWLALELEKQYPNDIGVLSSFFFNYVKLKTGEALYLGPNEPHAYLSGECIECMATSDNVVRAGLTPKFRDVQTLCSMLTYKQGYPEILRGIALNRYITRYTPPYDEFEVDSCSLPSGEHLVYPAVPSPSIFVVLSGEGDVQFGCSDFKDDIKEGDVLFVPAATQISLTAGALEALRLYRAGINGRFFSIGESRD